MDKFVIKGSDWIAFKYAINKFRGPGNFSWGIGLSFRVSFI
jgi:hypothetical protein